MLLLHTDTVLNESKINFKHTQWTLNEIINNKRAIEIIKKNHVGLQSDFIQPKSNEVFIYKLEIHQNK